MTDQRIGAIIRFLRIRHGWRQVDLAVRAGVSQAAVSRIERGHLETVTLDTLRRVAAALDLRLELIGRWRAGDLDRLMSGRHSRLHESVARFLVEKPGWAIRPEVSFSVWGERGVIDLFAYHPRRKALLVIELKTEIVDVNELVGTLDRKVRLAREAAKGVGWDLPSDVTISAWVIVLEGRTNRRRVQAHATMLRAAYPSDGRAVSGWLARPRAPLRCLSFWPAIRPVTKRPRRERGEGLARGG